MRTTKEKISRLAWAFAGRLCNCMIWLKYLSSVLFLNFQKLPWVYRGQKNQSRPINCWSFFSYSGSAWNIWNTTGENGNWSWKILTLLVCTGNSGNFQIFFYSWNVLNISSMTDPQPLICASTTCVVKRKLLRWYSVVVKATWKSDRHKGECLGWTGNYSVPASNIQIGQCHATLFLFFYEYVYNFALVNISSRADHY